MAARSACLPHGIDCEYLAEGGANVVYRVHLPKDAPATPPSCADLHSRPVVDDELRRVTTPPPTNVSPPQSPLSTSSCDLSQELSGWFLQSRAPLLRLKKDLPHLPTMKNQQAIYAEKIRPLLPRSAVIEQTLVALPESAMQQLNDDLKAMESTGSRPKKRHGSYLATSEIQGLLVEDMSSRSPSSERGLELKPKWLAQSPTAPRGARRCRTCALRVQRAVSSSGSHPGQTADGYCPLDLVSGERTAVQRALRKLVERGVSRANGVDSQHVVNLLTDFILNFDTVQQLRKLQQQLDPSGVLAIGTGRSVSEEFQKATTLRDCTLFLRVDADNIVEGKLGDLDLKTPEPGKLQYWQDVERSLIDGGYYLGTDGLSSGCRLERD